MQHANPSTRLEPPTGTGTLVDRMNSTTFDLALAGINRRLLAERYANAEQLLQRAHADRNLDALANARALVVCTRCSIVIQNEPWRIYGD